MFMQNDRFAMSIEVNLSTEQLIGSRIPEDDISQPILSVPVGLHSFLSWTTLTPFVGASRVATAC